MKFARFMSTPTGRILRGVAGSAILLVGLALQSVLGWILVAFGAVVLLSGVLNFCLIAPLLRAPLRGKNVCAVTSSGANACALPTAERQRS